MPHDSNIAEFGTLCRHRAVGTSGKENSMARKRYQHGRVFLKGKKEEKWVGRYREDVVEVTGATKRVRRSVILGTKRELPTKRLAERRLATILARINCLDYRPGRDATFGEFIERWETEVLATQKPSSVRAVRSHLRCYVIPEVGKLRLDEFGVESQQRFITRMPERSTAKVVSRKTILNVVATISTILATARNWGYSCEQIDMKKLRCHHAESRLRRGTSRLSRFSESSPSLENPGARYSAYARSMAFEPGKHSDFSGAISTLNSGSFKSEEPPGTGRFRPRRAGKAKQRFQFPTP
jgi:hypothetical protein